MKFAPDLVQQYDVFICMSLTMIFEAFITNEVLHLKTINQKLIEGFQGFLLETKQMKKSTIV